MTGLTVDRGTGAERRPALALLRAGLLPALAVLAVVAVVSLVRDGGGALGSALFGGALAMVALALGPLLLRVGRDLEPALLFVLAVGGYVTVVMALALVYALISDASWLSGDHAGAGVIAACAAWLVGQARATARMRVLAYGARVPPE